MTIPVLLDRCKLKGVLLSPSRHINADDKLRHHTEDVDHNHGVNAEEQASSGRRGYHDGLLLGFDQEKRRIAGTADCPG